MNRPALLAPLDPTRPPARVPVLIVGGGPVGLTAALLLAQRGIEVLLLERRGFTSRFPRAHLLNVRTMEIFHELGVADDIYAMGPADDRWRKVVWYTSVTGDTPLHGRKIGEVQAWGGGSDAERYAAASPRRFTNLPQIWLDRLLWRHADTACPGRIRGQQDVTGIDSGQDGATVTVTDRDSGTDYTVDARYVIVADGGRTSRAALDVTMDGPEAIRDVVSLYVNTQLPMWSEPDALLCHIISPAGRGRSSGGLQALGPTHYGRDSTEWLVAAAPNGDDGDTEPSLDDARRVLGVRADHPMALNAVSRWQYEGVIARRFRYGSAFLAGDAAHRHPPTGGLGLNCGVQDAHNLAWKLAAVVHDGAEDGLLDSYEAERRPIAAYYTAHSLENASRHAPIAAALGLHADSSEAQGWEQLAVWASDTPEGERRRAAVAEAVAANAADFSQLNVEAGYYYRSGALVPDGSAPPADADSAIVFRPTTRPGHHLPHVWLRHGSDTVSTIDLVSGAGLTLFTGAAGQQRWSAACAQVQQTAGCPLSLVIVGGDEFADADAVWAGVRDVPEDGAVLVRPDRVVAWRGVADPDQAAAVLDTIVATVLRGGADGQRADAAAPYLERIRRAAALVRR